MQICNHFSLIKCHFLSDEKLTAAHQLYASCTKIDDHEYYFYIEEEADDSPAADERDVFPASYYLCYDNETSFLAGFLSIISLDAANACLSGFVHPDYRQKCLFTEILNYAIEDFLSDTSLSIEFHLPDHRNIPEYISDILAKAAFHFSHHEYLMEYIFTENTCEHTYAPEVSKNGLSLSDAIEVLFDEEEQEFAIFYNDDYIGGAKIFTPDETSCLCDCEYVTFYDYEILEEYRGKGYGHYCFLVMLKQLDELHCKKLLLHVSGKNETAHKLYVRCGLKVHSSFSVYYLQCFAL